MTQQTAVELLKLFVFSLFITATLEVVKTVYSRFKGRPMQDETVKILNFVLALVYCYAADYGVLARVVETGSHLRESLLGWLDYIGTASLVYMGAGYVFDKLSSIKAKWDQTLASTVSQRPSNSA
jgi:hypothetical protein